MEVPLTADWVRMELALDYPLGTSQGDIVTLNEPQRFTALSVLDSLDKAVSIDRVKAEAEGVTFDRENWQPSDEVTAEIREEHRPHVRFLRGLQGLENFCLAILDDRLQFDPPLRDSQIDSFVSGMTHLMTVKPLEGGQGAFNDIAGGGGKSLAIAKFAEAFKSEEDPEDPNRVLVVVSDTEVQQELAGLNGESGFGRFAPDLDIEVITSSAKPGEKSVRIVTKDLFRRMIERDPSYAEYFDIILSDESHTLLGPKTSAAVRTVRRPIIGFTGTSEYSDKRQLSSLLPTRLTKYTSRELTEAGELAPTQYWIVKTGEVVKTDARRSEYSADELQRIASLPNRRAIAADFGLAFLKDNRNGAFSCSTIAEAREFAAALNGITTTTFDGRERPIKVVPIYGGLEDNHEIIQKLDDDEIQAITFVNIFSGWDAPRVSFLVNLRPTKSLVVASQRRARGQRHHFDANGLEVTCQIVDLVDTALPQDVEYDTYGVGKFARPDKQVLAPQLMGETVYSPGLVIASAASEGRRRDFSLDMLPSSLRWATTMASGVDLNKVHLLGSAAWREDAPDGNITKLEAARGLGITISRLEVVLAATSSNGDVPQYVTEARMAKVEKHLTDHDEPIAV